ncbi:MAG TPA: ABC transporter ATP-binding protein [Mycobacteriales bacterium]|nr:ABC transporter ATP-binding protein [Mycobacteriales bacterium]
MSELDPNPSAANVPLLELMDVHAAYGRIEVLHGVDLVVPKGTVVALLGPNGAGKTTTLSVIAGLVPATAGHVHLAGEHVNGASPDKLARAGLCTIPEGRGIFPNLSVSDNLRLVAYAGVSEEAVRETAFARFPRLAERRSQLAGTLSGGEQQMLAMARALSTQPALLLLDELSMGLAPLIVEELYRVVAQLAAEGVSVLVVEQFATTALAVSDYAVVMSHGRVTAIGQPSDVQDALAEAYHLGAA